jgi:plastocyanin
MANRIWGAALLVVLTLGACILAVSCKGKSNPAGPGGADVTINIVGQSGSNSFNPSTATITVGQTVSWHNTDVITHTSTESGIALWDTQNIAPGATSPPIHMNTAGTFAYHCAIHLSMTGSLVVNP